MGIQGLLPLLKSIHKPCHLRKFAGQTLGVDAFGWLHRGAVACAIDLALDKPTTKYVDFAMNRVRMLVHFGVTPYLVFDGDSLPSKGITNKARRKSRKESKEAGLNLLKSGKPAQAQFELQKSVDVTPEMVSLLIAELKRAGVKYIVAPYEADSQLAYLEKKGLIQGIISEDSDLLVFGARCLLTKLDQFGECVMIRRDDFTACREISLVGWTDGDFRKMAIMSGCDYLPNIGGMGLKTAYRLLRKYKTMERVIRNLQFEGKFKVPAEYEKDFEQAELSFIYPWVYCPVAKELVSLTPPEDDIDPHTLPYIGKYVESKIAEGVSSGLLHPRTKEPLIMPLIASKSQYSMPGPAAKRAAATQQPDLKRGKSIDSFFRPYRTPLAELDPNSFAASPHQQQTLEQTIGVSWPATPSPTVTAPRRLPSSLPGAARRTVSESVLRTPSTMPASRRSRSSVLPPSSEPPSLCSSTTDFRAIKRQRLCSIDDSADAETPTEQSSKFFADAPKQNKRKSELWSDESLDEALLDLPDEGIPRIPLAKSRKSIDIFQDDSLTPTASPANVLPLEVDTSQSTTGPTPFSQPEQGTQEVTPASSVEQQSEVIPNSAPRPKLRGLAARFSYFSQESVPTLKSTTSQEAVEKASGNKPVELKPTPPMTKLTKTLLSTVVGTHVLGSSSADKDAPPSSMIAVNGSEDWLVSESETEGSERLEMTASATNLNFSQFAFVPQA